MKKLTLLMIGALALAGCKQKPEDTHFDAQKREIHHGNMKAQVRIIEVDGQMYYLIVNPTSGMNLCPITPEPFSSILPELEQQPN